MDLDEYMYARTPHSSPESYTSIAKWLSSLPARVQVISTPWKMFSHAGSAQPGGIVNSIRHRSAAKDDNSKWLVRGAAVRGYHRHVAQRPL